MNFRTRMGVGTIGLVLICGLFVGGRFAAAALSVAVGYKAKTLCSGVFVSKLNEAAILADLQADDLAILRYISASIDSDGRSVRASVLGIVTRQALYRDGLGCALVLSDLDPPTLPPEAFSHPVGIIPAPVRGREGELEHERSRDDGGTIESVDAVVARAFSEPDPERRRRTSAVVVTRHGRIIAERYADGIEEDTPLTGWSMTKSVMNALVGVLVQEGRLALDAPVPVPEWHQPDDDRAFITLDHLLRMSSGLRFDEMASPRSDVMRMLFDVPDAAAFASSMPLAAAPGTRWQYSSGTSNILARVIRNVFHHEADYLTFPRRALFDRIGMSSAVLETDAGGTFMGSSYLYATARDWARFGQLYLQDGIWDGDRILPAEWVTYTTRSAPADTTGRYGAHFWLEVPEEYAGWDAHLPVPAFHAAGHEAQFVTIVPSYDLVLVRLGRTRYPEAWDHPTFVRDVLAALDSTEAMSAGADGRPTRR